MIDNIDASPLKKEAASRDFRTFLCRPPFLKEPHSISYPTYANIYEHLVVPSNKGAFKGREQLLLQTRRLVLSLFLFLPSIQRPTRADRLPALLSWRSCSKTNLGCGGLAEVRARHNKQSENIWVHGWGSLGMPTRPAPGPGQERGLLPPARSAHIIARPGAKRRPEGRRMA